MAAILTVDDEPGIREFIADVLAEAGHAVSQAVDGADALRRLEEQPFDILICDLRMPGELGGMDVVQRARAQWPDMQVIVLTAHGSVGTAVEAMRIGAFDFLEKPVAGPDVLRALVTRALNWRGSRRGAPFVVERGSVEADVIPTSTLRRFLRELKRRHVYNATATYAVIAFVVLQLAELVLPALPNAPSWLYTAIIVMLVAGFPVVIVLGWIYDLTAAGLKRTPS
ncbi:MAG TPA: response regulator [Longimicrobiales bacterium]|nr:response regulator [Longimicrobiales bacterium]